MRRLPESLKTWHCLALLLLAVAAADMSCLGNGLVGFDDAAVLSTSPRAPFGIGAVARMAAGLSRDPLRALPELVRVRPLAGASHMIDSALFGRDYWGHHLANTAYHFLACCFAFLAAAELLGSLPAGLAAALVFALHPVQTESVAYLAGRRDVLSGLFCLASIFVWVRGLRTGRSSSAAWAALLWALALLTKASAVTLPLLWLAAAASVAPGTLKTHLTRRRRFYAASAAACAAVVVSHLAREAADAARFGLPAGLMWHGGSAAAQWATEPRIVLHALGLLLWPARLSADYSAEVFTISRSFLEPGTLLSLAALGALAWLAWTARRARPPVAFAAAWIALTYAPMLHLLPAMHNGEPFAEHWLYLPVFGFALLLASLREELRRFPRASWSVLALVLCLYAGRTIVRNRDWRDAVTLWTETAETHPRCGRAQGILGRAYLERGDARAAEPPLRRALALRPDDPKHALNLAALLMGEGRFAEAEDLLRRTRALPLAKLLTGEIDYHMDLLSLRSGRPELMRRPWRGGRESGREEWQHDSLVLAGRVEAAQGGPEAAESAFVRALSLHPDSTTALFDLGLLYYGSRRYELAVHDFERLLRGAPENARALTYLGLAYSELGDPDRARRALDRALKSDPRSAEVWLAFSGFHLKRRELPRALAAAKQAARLEKSPRTDLQLYAVYRAM